MACWADIYGYVRPQFPDANADDISRLAVTGFTYILGRLGGLRRWESKPFVSYDMSVSVPEGFRFHQVYKVVVDGHDIPRESDFYHHKHRNRRGVDTWIPDDGLTGRFTRPTSYSAHDGTVRIHNGSTQCRLHGIIEIEYSLMPAAGNISCELPDDVYDKFAPAIAQWCLARLQATVTTNRSMHRVSQDYMQEFNTMLGLLINEQSHAGESRKFKVGGVQW